MYIGEGKITFSHTNNPKPREVYVFALSDQILITEYRDSKLSSKKYKFIENIPLENAQVEANLEDAKRLKNYSFKIKVKNSASMEPLIYTFQVDTFESFNKWIGDIQEAVGCCITSKSENKTSDISELLRWTEDELGYNLENNRNRSFSNNLTIQSSLRSGDEDYSSSVSRAEISKISPDGSKTSLDREKSFDTRSSVPLSPLRVGSRFSIDENKSNTDEFANSKGKPEKLQKRKPAFQQ
eukprot:NODE_551_length_6816_cov_0.293881.p3 type:complete len:240 gc:universal NODE_551_length_6816_cov_0.293881:4646-5365(+)